MSQRVDLLSLLRWGGRAEGVLGFAAGLLAIVLCSGCTSSGRTDGGETPGAWSGRSDRPGFALVINGEPLGFGELSEALGEAAGAQVVREAVLDRAIGAALLRAGLEVDAEAVEQERRLFAETVGAEGRDAAERVAARRGLGPVRFERFLRRNSGLRALVGDVESSEAGIAAEVDRRFGPAVRARLVVTSTEREAAEARDRAERDPGGASAGMAAAAFAVSIDPSAAAGGVFERARPSDPRWPGPLARALQTQMIGEIGPVIGFAGGAAVVLVEERFAGRVPTDAERAEAALAAQRLGETRAMAALARRLVTSADVTVLDPSLAWSVSAAGGLVSGGRGPGE